MTRKMERSRRGLVPARLELLETRALLTMAATAPLPSVEVAAPGSAVAPVTLDAYFRDSAPVANSFAVVQTSLGAIPVQLTPQATPATVANFLSYASKGAYNNAIVHRSVPGFIWQTGGYSLTSAGKVAAIAQDAPVVNEFGQSNVRGTIAMAKLGGNPNSATNQFFFNESDSNASNLDNQNGGFTVFGHVVGSEGLAVMDAVANVPASSGALSSPLDQAPLLNYVGGTTVQPSNFVVITSVTPASAVFQATSDAPSVATASIQNNVLTVTPLASGTARIAVTGFGSDGQPATSTFAVTVGKAPASLPTTPPTTSPPTTTSPPPTSTAPVATPPATTTTTTTAPKASVFAPKLNSKLPTSAVAGRATKIQPTVVLTSTGKALNQRERVDLSIYKVDGLSRPLITVASSSKAVKVRAGGRAGVKLTGLKVPATTSPGTYAVVATVTDPDGATTTIDTRQTLLVSAAHA